MRLLTFTNVYPSVDRPLHGIFIEERLRRLAAGGGLRAQVLALRPRAPSWAGARSSKAVRHGIEIEYLGVPTLPLVTNWIDPWLWARAAEPFVRRWLGENREDAILDAHFLYPDAVAAVLIGRRLGVRTVISARGSDVNVKCENAVMRRWVRWAAANCAALITVSRALAKRLAELDIAAPRLEVLPNGVDLDKFRPHERAAARARLDVSGRVLVSAGNLVASKGHDIAIEALAALPDATLLIVGEGPELRALQGLAQRRGVAARVRFLGLVPHERMAEVYSAADVSVLASAREGMPNVVLESLACGTPVVATDVGGIGEVVTAPVAGRLVRERSAAGLCEALERVFADPPVVASTRAFAQRFGWSAVIERQLALYRDLLGPTPVPIAVGAQAP
jgi:glycosyltransferase involved in cell wall biosynthesis